MPERLFSFGGLCLVGLVAAACASACGSSGASSGGAPAAGTQGDDASGPGSNDAADDVGASPSDAVEPAAPDAPAAPDSDGSPSTGAPPAVAIAEPAAGAWLRGEVSIRVDASDDGYVDRVVVTTGSKKIAEIGSTPYVAVWKTDLEPEGEHTLEALAYDDGGLVGATSVVVHVDRTPPSVALNQPEAGALLGAQVTLSATASDNGAIESVSFRALGPDGDVELAALQAPPWQATWDTTAASSGSWTVRAVARDQSGLIAEGNAEVVIDRPPVVTLDAPLEAEVVHGTTMIRGSATDDEAVTEVVVSVDGTPLATLGGGLFEVPWSTTLLAHGEHTIHVVATDARGQQGSTARTVTVDQPAAAALLVCESTATPPSECSGVAGSVTGEVVLKGVFKDDDDQASEATLLAGGSIVGALPPPFVFVWDSTTVEDGPVTLTLQVTTKAGKQVAATLTATVSNCDLDGDGHAAIACGGDDCADFNPAVHPGAFDKVGDGFDSTCDGVDGVDADGDGWASTESGGDDCNDANPLVHPCAEDTAGDGTDANCDGVFALSCDDCQPCTTDGFVAGIGCIHDPIPNGGACDDGDACTTGETCGGLGCGGGAPVSCDDGDPCTVDSCDAALGCTSEATGCGCAKDAGLCTVEEPVAYGPASVVTYLQIGANGKPGEGLDVDGLGPDDCAPAGDCSDGIDNSASGLGQFANGPLADAVAEGDLSLVVEAMGPLDGDFSVVLHQTAPVDASCDPSVATCDYYVDPSSYDCDCAPGTVFHDATLTGGVLTAGGDDSTLNIPFLLSEGISLQVGCRRATLTANATVAGGVLELQSGVIGCAMNKSALAAAIDAYPGEDIGGLPKSTVKLFFGSLQADIDTDGDGENDAISFGYKLQAHGAKLVGLMPGAD